MIKKILNYGYIFSRICGFFIISLTLINIIFFPEFANLDWVGYKYIFENTDLYISRFITEPSIALFSLIIYSFTHFLDYSSFRSVFAFLQCSLFFVFLNKIQYKILTFEFVKIIPIIVFLLFKVHIQIRESVSILLWMLALIDISKGKFFSIKNYIICFLSIINHHSILLFWISTFILEFKLISLRTKRISVYLIFFLMGFAISPLIFENWFYGIYYGTDPSQLYIPGELKFIEFNFSKLIYWSSYLIIYAKIFYEETISKKEIKYNSNFDIIEIFRFISLYGSFGLISITLLGCLFGDLTQLSYNLIFRYFLNFLILLSIYRSYKFPKKYSTILLNIFLIFDVFRMIIYPKSSFYPFILFDFKLST